MMGYQEGMLMGNLRAPGWVRHLYQKVDMRDAPQVGYHMGLEMKNLASQHWENHWVK